MTEDDISIHTHIWDLLKDGRMLQLVRDGEGILITEMGRPVRWVRASKTDDRGETSERFRAFRLEQALLTLKQAPIYCPLEDQ